MSIELWDTLHDGMINKIERQSPDELILTVEIRYLRHMFSYDGNSIIVKLSGIEKIEYEPNDSSPTTQELAAIEGARPWILSGQQADNNATDVYCSEGIIHLKYGDFSLSLDNGQEIFLRTWIASAPSIGMSGIEEQKRRGRNNALRTAWA